MFGKITEDEYELAVTALSLVIILFAGWLVIMMLARMIRARRTSGPDLASFSYVSSTWAVFVVIAGRNLFSWPKEVTLTILAVKALSVVAVTLWARIAKSSTLMEESS